MSRKIRSVWESLAKRGMAPPTFGRLSSEAWEFLARVVLPLPEFEFLLCCHDAQWKLKEWCKNNYSSWTHNRGMRPPPTKKIEDIDDVLNNSKLLRMDSPDAGGAVTSGSTTTGDDSDDEDGNDLDNKSDHDAIDEATPSSTGQKVCQIFIVLR